MVLPFALLFTLYATQLSVSTFVSPLPAIGVFGLDHHCSGNVSRSSLVPFVTIFGGRNFAIGMALLALYSKGICRAMSTVLICCTISSVVDTAVMSLWSMDGRAMGQTLSA